MPWMTVYLALVVSGLAVLAVLGIRVFREVRRLSGAVVRSSEEIARAARELNRAVRPPDTSSSVAPTGADRD